MLLGFSGKAGSGKDTAESFLRQFKYVKTAFADPLKESCIFKFNLSHNDVYTQEGKKRFVPEWGLTVREILQKEGTECTKSFWGEDFWCKRWVSTYNELKEQGFENISVTDVRFDAEAEAILALGGKIIEIVREGVNDKDTHSSEQGLSRHLISHTIPNNRTLADLEVEVIKLHRKYKNE
ncbi:hypothetical protein [Oligella sp. HMSC09E12]|uniref:deoxynucleotide monophosphate kinase family protein n=1 Tax=Oligella sp. HMSC09E12 TaxID=1581147 RepID=UPI0008A53FA6|nr:hypothetical protein [Oligella sp. HMSC09E12]OFV49736.1 hypothetical protein HMPREF3179_03760 [Oligella sp. HMSC09E12]